MTRTLEIADGLSLPIDYVTKTAAILAQRRKGKTYTASVIAEELVRLDQPWVALDPTGAWWGLRAGADGTDTGGLPVVILGGQHGDAPLEVGSGRFVAELVVDTPGWYVLDLSMLDTRSAERTFATEFGEALIRRKRQPGRDFPMHLFVDEADMFAPQERDGGGDARMLGAYQAIVRRGGLHGLGSTLISQRPALLNKSVLTQLDLLVLLRLVAGQDQDAVHKAYVSRAGTKEQAATLMASLASLRLGEAWVWEPGAEPPLFDRVQIRERLTFNSSATPKPGEHRVEPRGLADVDLDAVKAAMEAAIERAKADDPKLLRAEIASLRRELAEQQPEPVDAVEVEVRVEVPFVPADVEAASAAVMDAAAHLRERIIHARTQEPTEVRAAPVSRPATPTPAPTERRAPAVPAPQVAGLGKGEWKVLHVLAEYPEGRTVAQVAFLAGYSARASTIGNIIAALRREGLVERDQPIRLTAAGRDLAPVVEQPTGAELLAKWYAHPRMGEGERKVLEALIEAWPHALGLDELCDRTGYSPTASTIGNILSRLRKLGIVAKGARALHPDFASAIDA